MTERPKLSRTTRNFVLAAYLGHLLVPLFLLTDVGLAAAHGTALGTGGKVVGALSGTWLALGMGAWLFNRHRAQFLHRVRRPLLSVYILYTGAIVLELFVRMTMGSFLYRPGMRTYIEVDPVIQPGVSRHGVYTVNDLGLRGPSLPGGDDVYRIVTIGGSTTICAFLDDAKTWPQLLMDRSNSGQNRYRVWVGNAGVSGANTADHLEVLRALPIISRTHLAIFLFGINDLGAHLAFEGRSSHQRLKDRAAGLRRTLETGDRSASPRFKRLALYRLAYKNAADRLSLAGLVNIELNSMRRHRAEGKVLPLPDLQVGLEEYRERIRSIVQECQARRLRCVFLTQPTIWRGDLTPYEERLLHLGWIGQLPKPLGYASASDLARAMSAYNEVLLSVCRQDRLECYDLASFVPKDTSAFYDDAHFNERGAQIVAEFLAGHLLAAGL